MTEAYIVVLAAGKENRYENIDIVGVDKRI